MSDNLIPVDGRNDLVRDVHSHAIVNTDDKAYTQAVERHKKLKAEKEKMAAMETDINNIKNDMADIKNLLVELIKER